MLREYGLGTNVLGQNRSFFWFLSQFLSICCTDKQSIVFQASSVVDGLRKKKHVQKRKTISNSFRMVTIAIYPIQLLKEKTEIFLNSVLDIFSYLF